MPGDRRATQIASSNFQLVMLAEDGTLWAIGMGEHDRNANPVPLRVETDFHQPRVGVDRSTANAEVDPVDGRNYLLLPVESREGDRSAGARLRRGHQRVCLVTREAPLAEAAGNTDATTTPSTTSDLIIVPGALNRANFPEQGIYEVVVHEGEAYLIELALPVEKSGAEDAQLRVLNYSSGWRHNLLVVEDL